MMLWQSMGMATEHETKMMFADKVMDEIVLPVFFFVSYFSWCYI